MKLLKSEAFIADVERQFDWSAGKAGDAIAERYLAALEATCELLARQPLLGPGVAFSHPRLRGWRFFLVQRPFEKHVLFYEIAEDAVVLRRAMHGSRDLPRRLLQPPGAS